MARDHESDSRAIFIYNGHMQTLNNLISKIQNSQKTLFILCGLPYSGKSYVVRQLQSATDVKVVAIDDIFSVQGFDWDANALPGAEEWAIIFNESYDQVRQALISGNNVLYDSTNQTVTSRDKLRDVAKSVGADTKVIYIKCSTDTVFKRWEENQKNPTRSVVSRGLVQQTIDMFEEPTEDENVIVVSNH